jgi:hypothetical protein
MMQILIEKLRSYIIQNNLDLLLSLQQDFNVTRYLEDKVAGVEDQMNRWIAEGKPQYVIEELCLDELTRDLRPSKFNYIKGILEEEFLQTYEHFREMGVMTYEIINLIEATKPVLEHLGFTEENEESRELRYAIIGAIQEYLEK